MELHSAGLHLEVSCAFHVEASFISQPTSKNSARHDATLSRSDELIHRAVLSTSPLETIRALDDISDTVRLPMGSSHRHVLQPPIICCRLCHFSTLNAIATIHCRQLDDRPFLWCPCRSARLMIRQSSAGTCIHAQNGKRPQHRPA